jgi:hypothetical protein
MSRLAADLTSRPLGVVYERTGVSRDGVDIVWAMHEAGFIHRFGRPLPDEPRLPLEQVMTRTREVLGTNPHRVGRHTEDRVIETYVRRNYVDVEPWPFAAVIC